MFHSRNIRSILRVFFFYFLSLEVLSRNIRKFLLLKYNKVPFPETYETLFLRKNKKFFYFSKLGLKVHQVDAFSKRFIVDV